MNLYLLMGLIMLIVLIIASSTAAASANDVLHPSDYQLPLPNFLFRVTNSKSNVNETIIPAGSVAYLLDGNVHIDGSLYHPAGIVVITANPIVKGTLTRRFMHQPDVFARMKWYDATTDSPIHVQSSRMVSLLYHETLPIGPSTDLNAVAVGLPEDITVLQSIQPTESCMRLRAPFLITGYTREKPFFPGGQLPFSPNQTGEWGILATRYPVNQREFSRNISFVELGNSSVLVSGLNDSMRIFQLNQPNDTRYIHSNPR